MTSTIKVNKIEKESGSTITLGGPSTAVTLACGATQSGFGRTGTVDWCTTAKTGPLTIVSGNGYFINTTSGGITVTLPSSPSAGDIVALKDYANTWDSNAVTLARNGSKINGVCACVDLNTDSQSVTLIYVDGTKGWQDIHDSTSNVTGNEYMIATGGNTVTECGSHKIHTFTSSGTFTVTKAACTPANNAVAYMVIAGGGYGSCYRHGSAGGGGAGGFREGTTAPVVPYTASPLVAPTGVTVSAQAYPITVGAGSASGATNGTPSVFDSITSTGGGRGAVSGGDPGGPNCGAPGGSAGGGDGEGKSAGSGNTPPVSPAQGTNGGTGRAVGGCRAGGGGGGAAAAGTNGAPPKQGGPGGAGVSTEITGSAVTRAGGGGGNGQTPGGTAGNGGPGGGGAGTNGCAGGTPGTANTGGGGGAGNKTGCTTCGGQGGSGIVVIRYKFKA